MRSALWHLQRRALTEKEVRDRLGRKVKRAAAAHGDNEAAAAWVDSVVERLRSSLLVNDSTVAVARVEGARRLGKSKRRITQDLRQRGVSADDVAAAFAGDVGDAGDAAAAAAFVARKKLLTKDPQKALAALARQGFSYSIAKKALESGDGA